MTPPPEVDARRHRLPGTVLWLGVVSFLTDASGDMIYPLLPLFLTTVLGAGTSFVGAVEGVAETTASLLKILSGWLADRTPHKKRLTVAGYSLSSLARPLVAAAIAPWMVLVIRFVDRVGKGIRSSPRDALVAAVTPASQRGAAYGYHRAMDNAGAVLGPLVGYALMGGTVMGVALLGGHRFTLRGVFAMAAIPAALAVTVLVLAVRDQAPHAAKQQSSAATQHHRHDNRALWLYLSSVAVFTLGNSSDAFLLIRARAAGVDTTHILLLWSAHNATKALLSRFFGGLSDRVGRRGLIVAGWLLYGLVYLGFGLATRTWHIWALFVAYGLYYALVEGSERALVVDLAGPEYRGRAFGWFYGVTGLLALPASVGFGWLYRPERPLLAFAVAAGLAVAASLMLALTPRARTPA